MKKIKNLIREVKVRFLFGDETRGVYYHYYNQKFY